MLTGNIRYSCCSPRRSDRALVRRSGEHTGKLGGSIDFLTPEEAYTAHLHHSLDNRESPVGSRVSCHETQNRYRGRRAFYIGRLSRPIEHLPPDRRASLPAGAFRPGEQRFAARVPDYSRMLAV
jgi:hypothetical protein